MGEVMYYIEITSGADPRAGIEIGDIFKAKPYWLAPSEKYTLLEKVKGTGRKYEPQSMNHYKIHCRVLKKSEVAVL